MDSCGRRPRKPKVDLGCVLFGLLALGLPAVSNAGEPPVANGAPPDDATPPAGAPPAATGPAGTSETPESGRPEECVIEPGPREGPGELGMKPYFIDYRKPPPGFGISVPMDLGPLLQCPIRKADMRHPKVLESLSVSSVSGYWVNLKEVQEGPWLKDPNLRPDQNPHIALTAAVNGGGHRANAWTYGVLAGLEALQVGEGNALREVDAWSTVSGGGIPVLRMLAEWRRHPERAGRLESREGQAVDLEALRKNMDGVVLLTMRPLGGVGRFERAFLHPADHKEVFLSDLQDGRGPMWVPNSARLSDGARIPLSRPILEELGVQEGGFHLWEGVPQDPPIGLASWASSAVPGAMAPVGLPAHGGKSALWLIDGAWGDRFGVLTAVDLARQMAPCKKVVLVIESRPFPQFHRHNYLGGKRSAGRVRWGLFQRTNFVGTSLELVRQRTDELLAEALFGEAQRGNLSTTQERALRHEGMQNRPARFPVDSHVAIVRKDLDEEPAEVQLVRLSADALLQPGSWDLPKQNPACERIAARLYSVVAVQPTNLSLKPPTRVIAADIHPRLENDALVYSYSPEALQERQSALIAAGYLSVWLQQDRLSEALTVDGRQVIGAYPAVPENFFVDLAPLAFHSKVAAEEWRACTGLAYPGRDKPEYGNCRDRHEAATGGFGGDLVGTPMDKLPHGGAEPPCHPRAGIGLPHTATGLGG